LTSQALGQWRTLAIFLISGICGNILQKWFNSDTTVPTIGASGAVSGLAGVYVGLAVQWRLPYAEVWPLAHPVPPMQVAAFALIGFVGDMILLARHDQKIAYGAHLGGLLTGVVIAAVITTIYPSDEAYNRAQRRRRN
jgi:membrane associated rhomboid family serine protease